MGRNFKVLLGYLLVISLTWSIEAASLQKVPRVKRNVAPIIPNNATSTTTTTTLQTTNSNITEVKHINNTSQISNQSSHAGDKTEEKKQDIQISNNKTKQQTGRSLNIDIEKYVSPEFHNKNNVYSFPTSPEIQKYTDPDIHQISDRIDTGDESFGTSSASTPLDFLDDKYRNVADSIKQNLEELESSLKEIEQNNEEENVKYVISKLIDNVKTKDNDTNASLKVNEVKTVEKVDEINRNHKNGSNTITNSKNVDFSSNFYKTQTFDEKESNENPNNISENKNKPDERVVESSLKRLLKEKVTTELPTTKKSQENIETGSSKSKSETTLETTSSKSKAEENLGTTTRRRPQEELEITSTRIKSEGIGTSRRKSHEDLEDTESRKKSKESIENTSSTRKPQGDIDTTSLRKNSQENVETTTSKRNFETSKPRSRQFSMETTTFTNKDTTDNTIQLKRGSTKYNDFIKGLPVKSTTPTVSKEMIDFDGKGFSIPPSATAWSLATMKNVPELATVDLNGTVTITTAKNVELNSIDKNKIKDSIIEENSLVKVKVPEPENIERQDDLDIFADPVTTVSELNTDVITTNEPPKTTPTMIWTTLWEEMKRIVNETDLPGVHPFTISSAEKNGTVILKNPSKTIPKHENEIFKTSEEATEIKLEKHDTNKTLEVQNTSTIPPEEGDNNTETYYLETQTTTESTTQPLNMSFEQNITSTTEMTTTFAETSTESTTKISEEIITTITTDDSLVSTTESSFSTEPNTSREDSKPMNLTSKPDLRIVSVTENPLLDEPVTNNTRRKEEDKSRTEVNEIETTEISTETSTIKSSIITEIISTTLGSTQEPPVSTIKPLLENFTAPFLDPIVEVENDSDSHEERPKDKHTSKEFGPKNIEPAVIENNDDDLGNKIPDGVNKQTTVPVRVTTKSSTTTTMTTETNEVTGTTTSTSTTTSSENLVHDDGEKDESNPGMIAAIAISSIAAICLVILAGLLIVMRKRQKRVTYGQRCRPVSLDAYSLDNVSVYNSVRRKGGVRASKRSYGNPAFDDPVSVSHPMIFQALVKFNDNQEGISAEYEEIPQITAKTSELPPGCETKNRYANIIPLPESRVFLKASDNDPHSDYINANYVTGSKNARCYYIACQAPMENTIDDFWRMIWEQNCRVILMLTNLYENGVEKCADYLPPSEVLDCHRLFGDYQITLKKRDVKEKYIISSLQLKNMVSNSWREVTHLWYLGWPERGVPHESNSLIAFLIEARSHLKPAAVNNNNSNNDEKAVEHSNIRRAGVLGSEGGPVVVHCSPGTGRTGTVIACDIAIRDFELTRQVDIPKIVYRIRRDRASAVQTRDQYAFIYKVITLYATKLTGGALDSI